jgi:hypothetical protein
MRKTAGAAKDPHVVVCIDCDVNPKSHPPLRWNPGKVWVYLELWQTAFSYMRSFHRRSLSDDGLEQRWHPKQESSDQDKTDQYSAFHGFSPAYELDDEK